MFIQGPQQENIEIKNIVLDLNGTLSASGIVSDKTKAQILTLKKLGYHILLISGDIRGTASDIAKELDIDLFLGKNSEEKAQKMQALQAEKTAAIGNARIDIGTFQNAKLAIATLQSEGIHTGIIPFVDIIVPNINDALNLFIETQSLEATLRI